MKAKVDIPKEVLEQIKDGPPKTGRKVRQINWFDEETGKLLSTATGHVQSAFGVGWVMFNKRKVRGLCKDLPATAVTVLLFLMAKQTYSEAVQTTWVSLGRELGLSQSTMLRVADVLRRKGVVRDVSMEGQRAILLNPELTACGRSSLATRRTLWHLAYVMQGITTSRTPMVVNDVEELRDSPALRGGLENLAQRMEAVDLETGEILGPKSATNIAFNNTKDISAGPPSMMRGDDDEE